MYVRICVKYAEEKPNKKPIHSYRRDGVKYFHKYYSRIQKGCKLMEEKDEMNR